MTYVTTEPKALSIAAMRKPGPARAGRVHTVLAVTDQEATRAALTVVAYVSTPAEARTVLGVLGLTDTLRTIGARRGTP